MVRGRVVDAHGRPLRDAVITPRGITTAGPDGRPHKIIGSVRGLEPVAVTDAQGELEMAYNQPVLKMLLWVEARGMAPKLFKDVPTGAERQTLAVGDGATVRGRLVQNGKPVPDAEIGLFGQDQVNGNGYDEIRIGTQADGTFVFTNVSAPVEWWAYGKMESIASRGATTPVSVATARDGQEIDLGDLAIQPGHKLSGRVILSDGKSIPEGCAFSCPPVARCARRDFSISG